MTLDVRGYSCPQPLMMTMKALKNQEEDLEVIVDSMVCVENISRYVKHNNMNVSHSKGETGDFTIKISKN